MNDDVTVVFHGFLNLTNLEKLALVESINEYFDSTEREPIRAANNEAFSKLAVVDADKICKCCGHLMI
jgi:hypothetical protein